MRSHPSKTQSAIKRVVDRCAAALLLVVLSPVISVVALLVWLIMGRPILFRQPRAGFRGRTFRIVKFRTMTGARDANGELLPDARRLGAVGHFLRATSLDELPELFNVLKGELSLVGPRPLLARYMERYSEEQARRHEVMPGITGWAQVNGRNDLTWEEKFTLDVWYVDHWSLWLDLRILMRTFWQVGRQSGISRAGHATTTEFMGSPACNELERS
jgi:sugar transferase EpsL